MCESGKERSWSNISDVFADVNMHDELAHAELRCDAVFMHARPVEAATGRPSLSLAARVRVPARGDCPFFHVQARHVCSGGQALSAEAAHHRSPGADAVSHESPQG